MSSPKRFRVAFSFAGEKRDFVAQVAALLAARFTEAAILYDKYHEAEFARRDLGFYLPELYRDKSDLVVVVVCRDYQQKEWCGLEWDAIFDLLKKWKNSEVMLCRFDHATVQGLYSTAGFVELDDKTPEQTKTRILERLALNEGQPKDYYHTDATLVSGKPPPALDRSCPYVGLRFYVPEDWDRFFGRSAITRDILGRLTNQRVLMVYGPSGCGKSSLLRAGVIVQWRQKIPNGRTAIFTPDRDPFHEFVTVVANDSGLAREGLIRVLLHLRGIG